MRHLVQQRIHPLGSVPREEEVHVERDLDHVPMPVPVPPRHHVSEGRPHAVAESERDVVGQHPVEPSPIEVSIEGSQIFALLLRAAASMRSATAAAAVVRRPHLLQGRSELRPVEHDRAGVARSGRPDPLAPHDDGERIDDVRGCVSVRLMEVQGRPSLRQRPYGGTISTERHPFQTDRAPAPQRRLERLRSMSFRHASKKRKLNSAARHKMSYVVAARIQHLVSGCDALLRTRGVKL
jgi:hypothetical protein